VLLLLSTACWSLLLFRSTTGEHHTQLADVRHAAGH
jgi:hypothetical protein